MKPLIYSVAAAVVAGFVMVAWSIAGNMMTRGGDLDVLQGLIIMAGIVGLGGTAAIAGARRLANHFAEPPKEPKKGCCR
jgi:hypothetical protein